MFKHTWLNEVMIYTSVSNLSGIGAPRELVVSANALVEILQFLTQYANDNLPRPEQVESFGFLVCKVEEDVNKYVVVDAVGVAKGHPSGVTLSDEELAIVETINAKIQARDPSLFLGGWFHSHPGHGLFYSETDCRNQMFWQQQNPDGVGIVFDHTLVRRDSLGVKAFRLKDPNGFDYAEVPFKIRGITPELLEDALSLMPVSLDFIHGLYQNLHLLGLVEEAPPPSPIDQLKIDLAAKPGDLEGWRKLGRLAWEKHDFNQVYNAFQQVNALTNGTDLEATIYIYLAYIKAGEEVIARDMFNKLVDLIGGDLAAWRDLGEQLADLGDFSGAINCYIQAIRCDPTDLDLVNRLKELSLAQAEAAKQLAFKTGAL
ncbi:MAG: hypothetical protein ACTSU5_01645 [Promethearchaeota archaeon]